MTFTGELLQDLVNNVRIRTTKGIAYSFTHSSKLHKPYEFRSDKESLGVFGSQSSSDKKLTRKRIVKRKKIELGKKQKTAREKYSDIYGYLSELGYDYLRVGYFPVDNFIKRATPLMRRRIFEKLQNIKL
jgi:hypothetical protein